MSRPPSTATSLTNVNNGFDEDTPDGDTPLSARSSVNMLLSLPGRLPFCDKCYGYHSVTSATSLAYCNGEGGVILLSYYYYYCTGAVQVMQPTSLKRRRSCETC